MSLAKHPSSTVQILGAEKVRKRIFFQKTVLGNNKNEMGWKKLWVGKNPMVSKKIGWLKNSCCFFLED